MSTEFEFPKPKKRNQKPNPYGAVTFNVGLVRLVELRELAKKKDITVSSMLIAMVDHCLKNAKG